MIGYILMIRDFKTFHSRAKLLAAIGENAVVVSRITLQVDGMIHEYRKDESKNAADRIRKRVNAVKADLERLTRPTGTGTFGTGVVFSTGEAERQIVKHEMDVVLASWAHAELMRIDLEQLLGRLPPDPTPWRMVRPRVIQFRHAWILLGRQLRSAASIIDKDIGRSEQVRSQLRNARVQPGLTKDDIDLLSGDHDRMMREEMPMRRDRDRIRKLAEHTDASADALQNLIAFRDALSD